MEFCREVDQIKSTGLNPIRRSLRSGFEENL